MKIFLNDRVIEFVEVNPGSHLASDFIYEHGTREQLREAWTDFERYEKFRKFIVVSPAPVIQPPLTEEEQAYPFLRGSSQAFRDFFGMFKYVPAAGGLVKNEKGEFLFIHRLGFWDLPKGKIDKKDILRQGSSIHDEAVASYAAIREVTEETGLRSVTVTGKLPSTWHLYTAKEKQVLKQTSWFAMEAESSQPLKPQASEGIFLAKWTPPGAIHCILTHTYASIRELLLELVF